MPLNPIFAYKFNKIKEEKLFACFLVKKTKKKANTNKKNNPPRISKSRNASPITV